MNKHLIPVKDDLYHIAEELTRIDSRYRVFFNRKSGRYELHTTERRRGHLLTFPFDGLDYRCVEHTRKTRAERAERILAELEESAKSVEKAALAKAKEQIAERIEEGL
ncbi:MAG: hypothetical protein ACOYIQ_02540 [Christensenellales bacterium]|jgi:hypothetical protein